MALDPIAALQILSTIAESCAAILSIFAMVVVFLIQRHREKIKDRERIWERSVARFHDTFHKIIGLPDFKELVREWLDFVIKQLAKNKYVDIEAIDRIKKWDIPDRKISNYYWQKIIERLDDIPNIREEMQREKERFVQSGNFRRVLGIDESRSIVVTKDMVGKEKLDEIKKELSNLK